MIENSIFRKILIAYLFFATLTMPLIPCVGQVSADGGSNGTGMNLSVNIQNYFPQVFGDSLGFTWSSPREAFTVEYWDTPKSAVMQWGQDIDGTLLDNVEATSLDGLVTILIAEGTRVLDIEGNPLSMIMVTLLYSSSGEVYQEQLPDAPDGYTLVAAFDFKPDGTRFIGSSIQIVLHLDHHSINDDSVPVIAFYNEESNSWEYISGTLGPEDHDITFATDHFTIYAIFEALQLSPAPVQPGLPHYSISTTWWIILAGVLGIPFLWILSLLGIYVDRRKNP